MNGLRKIDKDEVEERWKRQQGSIDRSAQQLDAFPVQTM
jgi:hypothetical protein